MHPGPTTAPPARKPADPAKAVLPAKPKSAVLVALTFTALLYVIEAVDQVLPAELDQAGIVARTWSGLDGVLWAPLLHAGWGHLLANTVPVALFAFLALSRGVGQFGAVTATIWTVGGLGVWLAGPSDAVTVGASGLAFGWLAYLLVRGLFNRSIGQLLLAAVLLFFYGGMLLYGTVGFAADNVSQVGHVSGAVAGVLAAWLVSRADKATRPAAAPGNLRS